MIKKEDRNIGWDESDKSGVACGLCRFLQVAVSMMIQRAVFTEQWMILFMEIFCVNDTQKLSSDIDVVMEGDSMRVDIIEYIKSLFDITVDVLWVDLMKKEDDELDRFAVANGLPINKYSAYKTVMQEVRWI